MNLVERYIQYIKGVRRYSVRTVDMYSDVLRDYCLHVFREDPYSDSGLIESISPALVRSYEVMLLD